jgi:hypothetical protein
MIVLIDGECNAWPNRTEMATLTAADARQLGVALIAVADEIEQMSEYDQITV